MQSLKRRVASKNGRVQMYAIGVSASRPTSEAEVVSEILIDVAGGYVHQEWRRPLSSGDCEQGVCR